MTNNFSDTLKFLVALLVIIWIICKLFPNTLNVLSEGFSFNGEYCAVGKSVPEPVWIVPNEPMPVAPQMNPRNYLLFSPPICHTIANQGAYQCSPSYLQAPSHQGLTLT